MLLYIYLYLRISECFMSERYDFYGLVIWKVENNGRFSMYIFAQVRGIVQEINTCLVCVIG